MPSDIAKKFAYLIKHYPELMLPPSLTPEEIRKRKSAGAKRGHLRRRICQKEILTGESLEHAVRVAGENSEIAAKLRAGQPLSEYELYLMVDVYLARP